MVFFNVFHSKLKSNLINDKEKFHSILKFENI